MFAKISIYFAIANLLIQKRNCFCFFRPYSQYPPHFQHHVAGWICISCLLLTENIIWVGKCINLAYFQRPPSILLLLFCLFLGKFYMKWLFCIKLSSVHRPFFIKYYIVQIFICTSCISFENNTPFELLNHEKDSPTLSQKSARGRTRTSCAGWGTP